MVAVDSVGGKTDAVCGALLAQRTGRSFNGWLLMSTGWAVASTVQWCGIGPPVTRTRTTGSPTVIRLCRLCDPPKFAVMVTTPALMPITRPVWSTVAICGLEDDHRTAPGLSRLGPKAGSAEAPAQIDVSTIWSAAWTPTPPMLGNR